MTYKKKKKNHNNSRINSIGPFLQTRRLTLSSVARNIGDINDDSCARMEIHRPITNGLEKGKEEGEGKKRGEKEICETTS